MAKAKLETYRKLHSIYEGAVRQELGREPDLTLWKNTKGEKVGDNYRTKPGLIRGAWDLVGILTMSVFIKNDEFKDGMGILNQIEFGRFFSLEIKTEDYPTLSEDQVLWGELVRSRGGFACVILPANEAEARLQARSAIKRARLGQHE